MKNIYKIRLGAALFIFVMAILGILGVFYPVKIFDLQLVPVFQRVIIDFSIIGLVILIFLAGLTLIFGRIYCSLICPLGILQEIAGIIKGKIKKNNCPPGKNFPLKYFIAAAVWGIFAGGSAVAIRYIDPYSLFSSAFSGVAAGICLILVILAAVTWKNRIFCTNFCPAGTVLGLLAKISFNKIYMSQDCVSCGLCEKNCPAGAINAKEKAVDNEICLKCLKCVSICPKGAMKYGRKPASKAKFSPNRRKIIIAASALAIFGAMIKAGIELKDKIAEKIKDVILPPGAENKERFINSCLNCNLCVENCPNKIIQKADNEFGAVHLDYSKNPCKFDCKKCSEVCPSGAIRRISLDEKQKTRIAMAMISEEKCTKCGLCAQACPTHAIIKSEGKTPVLNAQKCIGCGACKHACNFGAIEIFPIREQRTL